MTDFVLRVTIICPEQMRDDANNLAAVLGFSAADLNTFGAPDYQDAMGNLYSVASTLARATFPSNATSALVRPAWDASDEAVTYAVNMAGANRAQRALVIYNPEAPVPANPSLLLAIVDDDPLVALSNAGVSKVFT